MLVIITFNNEVSNLGTLCKTLNFDYKEKDYIHQVLPILREACRQQ